MAAQNLWEKHPKMEGAIQALPNELQSLLARPEAALLATSWLKKTHPVHSLRETAGEPVFHWDMVGMFFGTQRRFFEAISVHRELYHLMCEAQDGHGWIHKGLPLVRLRDWHKALNHPWHEERYLLLTLVEDAIREKGNITPEKGGIYHRFRWEHGRPDTEFREIANRSWEEFDKDSDLREFPEEILQRLGPRMLKKAASQSEADSYEINAVYVSKLYQRASDKDWKAFERLAAYELACIPGFEVEAQKRTQASVFDAFIRIRGSYVDFRRELGSYLLAECKNWEDPVGPEAIAYLAQNLTFHQCVAGILFSRTGITGTREMKYAALTVLRAYHHGGKIILVLSDQDFQRASQGVPLQEILRQKYEQVRFDLPLGS